MYFKPPNTFRTKSPTLQKHLENCLPHPKEYFGRLAKENGIPTPTIYDSCKDMAKGFKMGNRIIRSEWEHERFYSGLLVSPSHKMFNWLPKRKSSAIALVKGASLEEWHKVREFIRILGMDFEAEWAKVSVSFWESMEGRNLTIIGDSAVAGRYHIVMGNNYVCAAQEGIICQNVEQWGGLPFSDIKDKAIPLYEKACEVFCDGQAHRPIIEAVLNEKGIYFLQLHPGRDFEPAAFKLDRPPQKGEIKASFVRGATVNPEGETCSAVLYPEEGERDYSMPRFIHVPLECGENELISRAAPVLFEPLAPHFCDVQMGGHAVVSRAFKPRISLKFRDLENRFDCEEAFCWKHVFTAATFREAKDRFSIPAESLEFEHILFDNGERMLTDGGNRFLVFERTDYAKREAGKRVFVHYVSDGTTGYVSRVG